MKSTAKYLGLLLVLPMFIVALSAGASAPDVAAGSADRIVCGDRLCSEVPGGYLAYWNKDTPSETQRDDHDRMQHDDKMMMKHDDEDHDAMMEDHDAMMKDDDSMMKDDDSMMEKHDSMMKDDDSMMEKHEKYAGSSLRLSRANVATEIPLNHGYYNGGDVYFIITDSSEQIHADTITEKQGWKVELAPLMANAPEGALSPAYFFTNGIEGAGVHGYQSEVFSSTPAQADVYSALTSHVHVTWADDSNASLLMSEQEILDAAEAGDVVLSDLNVVINMPQIVWPEGQMLVKEDKTVTDKTEYGGGQVLDINTEEMTVTFIAHRGWGPDGRTVYYIVTDMTPTGVAEKMGTVDSPTSAELIANSAAVDLYQFKNGIKGTGPLGFQPGIASGAPGDANYSPMWRIFLVEWENPEYAKLLETVGDINHYQSMEKISVDIARPMDADHIVNCPFIDPFQ